MSYDLFLEPRSGHMEQDRFVEYFPSRPHYTMDTTQACYENGDTGVYFVLGFRHESECSEDNAFPVSVNINYFRPSYFILEAEPEITAFVRTFDMVVSDPQLDGMGEGEYDPELLKAGWNRGNDFGYSAILSDPENRGNVLSLPAAVLRKAWSWNFRKNALQRELGETRFVPRVWFAMLEGQVVTVAVWPDGIPIAVPEVDYLVVPRKELAPRRFLRRVEDHALVPMANALPILERHRSPQMPEVLILDYGRPPKDIVSYVKSLPGGQQQTTGLPSDQVLDREIVRKYWGPIASE